MAAEIFKCFIASPSDTQSEREICDKVFAEINKNLGQHLNFRVESWKWENNSRPSFGNDGQAVINEQVEDYQIFVGIMHSRFGFPTPRAGSGTEEEFDIAYDKYRNNKDVEIMLYFNDAPIPRKNIFPEQIQKINTFKEKVSNLGGLYCEYDGSDDFENKLRGHFNSFFLKKKQNLDDSIEKSQSSITIAEKLKISVLSILDQRLRDALHTYEDQPSIWIEPVLSRAGDESQSADDNYDGRVLLTDFIAKPKSSIIKAPPQFGLTCLAHYLVKEAWEIDDLWIYVDASKTKVHSATKSIVNSIKSLGLSDKKLTCIVIDSCNNHDPNGVKIVNAIAEEYPDVAVVVMTTIDDSAFQKEEHDNLIRDYDILNLLALPRGQVRKIVYLYNKEKKIGEDDVVLNRVINDLDTLNIHRTALNCLTLLKVSERYYNESPVNRTRMLEMVLFILFDLNMNGIPNYKSRPDVRDCEYVLGRFCEQLIKGGVNEFSRETFLDDLNSFCKEKLIELDVNIVFDILVKNCIIVQIGLVFRFRFSYWIFYFAAKRMHSEKDFAEYIFAEDRYVSFPELIEFYTGIDRNRADALLILIKDIRETCATVRGKVRLPDDMNPFGLMKWNPSEEAISKMQQEIGEDVINSGLPAEVKDQYADRTYDQTKPYNQTMHSIMKEYSLLTLMQQIKAASRALRNSDYVNPDIKRELLKEIVRSWEEVSKVLLVLAPIMAQQGHAGFEGATFMLLGNFGETFEEKLQEIILVNPRNVVGFFQDDLYSNKLGPLLYDQIEEADNDFSKHQLNILLAKERPKHWRRELEKYIVSIQKNSFYIYDIFMLLRLQYRYAFVDNSTLREIGYLIKICLAKHMYGDKKPGLHRIKELDRDMKRRNGKDILPKREFENED